MLRVVGVLLTVAFPIFTGCEILQPSVQVLPPHIRKLAVGLFANRTAVAGLEDRLRLETFNEFVRDGRFAVVSSPDDADGYVTGEILYYILQPTQYGPANDPQQFKLRLIMNLYFVDRVNNVTLWQERNLEEVLFFTAATLPGGRSEEDARNAALSNLARKIYVRTIDGFGSVTGTSEKKVPQH